MANFFDVIAAFGRTSSNRVRYGIHTGEGVNEEVSPENITTQFTCVKILAESFAKPDIKIRDPKGNEVDHEFLEKWNYRPNSWMNTNSIRTALEWERETYGNCFLYESDKNLVYVPAQLVSDYYIKKGELVYEIMGCMDTQYQDLNLPSEIPASKMLHFRGITANGIMGLSPLTAAHGTHQLMSNAYRTVSNFYKNDAMSRYAVESEIRGTDEYKAVQQDKKEFDKENVGVENAGKPIWLPINHKLTPLAVKFADAELIETMKFGRDEITSLYEIPNYMLSSNDSNLNVEQQTTAFVAQITKSVFEAYASEIAYKKLPYKYTVEFDIDSLIESTFKDKVTTYKEAVTNALVTPNEAAARLRLPKVEGKFGDMHFTQAQYIPLEMYEKYNPLLKNSPITDKALKDNNLNK